ncbi:LANO_0D04434g1_1 [Lachancea nothofagi CBS 11611]|uniref:dolichol kinase n=1 Tax=Lachancea nothofagi CBS 11611 TaxID=1266666 RepID=A0A1G4JGZ2_9SACH|nr:LANO_0D04434g1_1 [Lachancea nothofagi CBS 11611]
MSTNAKEDGSERAIIERENENFSVIDALLGPERIAQLLIVGSTVHLAVIKYMQDESDYELFQSILTTAVAILVGFGISYRTRVANNGFYGSKLVRTAEFVPDFNVLYLLYIPTFLSLLFARQVTIVNLAMAFNCTDLAVYMRLPAQAIFVLLSEQSYDDRFTFLKAIVLNCVLAFLMEKIGKLKSFDRVECNLFSICLTNVLFLIESPTLHFQVLQNVLKGFLTAIAINYPLIKITSNTKPYVRSAILFSSFICVFPLTVLHIFKVEGQNPAYWLYNYITSDSTRVKILSCWLAGLVLLIPNILVFKSNFSLDSSRKIWHFIILALVVPPFKQDPEFVKIALAGTAVTFLAVEYLRYLKLAPFGDVLDAKLRSFADFRDERGPIIISYIYLVIGVASPILINDSLVGVVSLGVGDSLASIVGYRWGRHRWPGTNKTFEGTVAFITATSVCSLLFQRFLGEFQDITSMKLVLICIFSGLLEGNSVLNDNILVPSFMLIIREVFK